MNNRVDYEKFSKRINKYHNNNHDNDNCEKNKSKPIIQKKYCYIKSNDGVTGPTGPIGPCGPRGKQGYRGYPGEKGERGYPGPEGERGPRGQPGINGSTGPIGPTGIQGPPGLVGPTGPRGEVGRNGMKGDIGPTGPKGDRGLQGPMGIPGSATTKGYNPCPKYEKFKDIKIPNDYLSYEFDEQCIKIWGKIVCDPIKRELTNNNSNEDLIDILPIRIDLPNELNSHIGNNNINYDSCCGIASVQIISQKDPIINFIDEFKEENWELSGNGSYSVINSNQELDINCFSSDLSFITSLFIKIPCSGKLIFDWNMVSDECVSFARFDYLINTTSTIIATEDGSGSLEINVDKCDIFTFEISVAKSFQSLTNGVDINITNFSFIPSKEQTGSVCGLATIQNINETDEKIVLQVGPTFLNIDNAIKYIYSYELKGLLN